MISPAELVSRHTDLDEGASEYLQRMMGSWGALSDLSFSDLLLVVPLRRPNDGRWVVLGQIRPTTGATLLRVDLVGHGIDGADWEGIEEALETGTVSVGTIPLAEVLPTPPSPTVAAPSDAGLATGASGRNLGSSPPTGEVPAIGERALLESLPVRCNGAVVAVVARVGPLVERRKGRLERVYRDLYQRLASMVAAGEFPQAGEEAVTEDAPRVGDGLLVTDAEGRITYASPNAMSALHRMGVSEVVEGHRMSELGVEEAAVDAALATGKPVIEEVERRPDVIVLVHCTPLVESGTSTGAMVLLRDVTDLRRLDRLLLSKDAAIREVHHRVKNNLQTISSLLRLQARRLDAGKGREALREAERRVRSIAVVHEILSRDPGDQVPFGEIVAALVRMTEDSVIPGHEVGISVEGSAGDLPADVATPLALVLAELLQNAVEHAFSDRAEEAEPAAGPEKPEPTAAADSCSSVPGHVRVLLANDESILTLEVRDDGRGIPEGFDIDATTSLGLSIVRDLVRSQLGGAITMRNDGGAAITIEIPLRPGHHVRVGQL